eukprot:1182544-Prymnesium_polylepis.1
MRVAAEAAREKVAAQAAREKVARQKAVEEGRQLKGELAQAKGENARLGACVVRWHKELEREQQQHAASIASAQRQLEAVEADEAEAAAELKRVRVLKSAAMAQLRELKRSAADRAETSEKRLRRAQEAEAEAKALRAENEQLHECIEGRGGEGESDAEDSGALTAAPRVAGRFGKLPWQLRKLAHKWLARRTPPAMAGPNLVDAALFFGVKHFREPSLGQRRCDVHAWRPPAARVPHAQHARTPHARATRARATRAHATRARNTRAPIPATRTAALTLATTLATWQVALAKRVLSFGFDETTKKGDGLASTNTQIETETGAIIDVVLRGAFIIPGGCADQVSRAMEEKLMARGRKLIAKAKEVYEAKWGVGTWEGPDPAKLGIHQLSGSVIMSDTCTPARAAKRMIMEQVASAIEIHIGAVAWALLSPEQKMDKTRTYIGDCTQHLRNIVLDAMSACGSKLLQD